MSQLPRIFFDRNVGTEDDYWLAVPQSVADLEAFRDQLSEDVRVVIYMPDEIEMEAILHHDDRLRIWIATPIPNTIVNLADSKGNLVDLEIILDRVHDEGSFIDFIEALGSDFARKQELELVNPSSPNEPGRLGWENGTIDTFLESAAACASDGGPSSEEMNPWQRCAQILYSGKYYE